MTIANFFAPAGGLDKSTARAGVACPCNRNASNAAQEPIISHLKYGYRMLENYLGGEKGVQINALMAGAAWNFKKMMEKLKEKILWLIFQLFFQKKLQPLTLKIEGW